jgi:hypothetical protein
MGQLLFGLPRSLTSSVFLSVKEGLQACCNKHVFTSICTKHAVHREHDGVVQFQTWNQAQVSCSLNAQFSVHFALLYSRLWWSCCSFHVLQCQPISLSTLQQQSFQLLQEAANMWLQVQSMKIRPLTTCGFSSSCVLSHLLTVLYSSFLPHAQNICEHYFITFYLL